MCQSHRPFSFSLSFATRLFGIVEQGGIRSGSEIKSELLSFKERINDLLRRSGDRLAADAFDKIMPMIHS